MLNKALKLTVISAVLMTSGFAQQQATISGDITNNNIFEIGNGVTVNMADGSVIHNYGNIKGSGEIDGTANATIINYNHIIEATENDPNCFRPTGGGSVEGTINKTNVTVTDQKADISVSFDDSNKVGNTILLTTNNCDTTDTDKVLDMTNTSENPIDVLANIANELNGSGVSHSLRVVGNVRLKGDQSRFNEEGTEWTTSEAVIEIANPNGFPQVPVKVNDESEININASGVNITKDVTVVASQFNIAPKGHFRLDKATLCIKGPVQVFTSEASPFLTGIDPENIDTIAVYERKEGMDPPLVALRTASLNSAAKSGRAVTEDVIAAETAYVYGPNSVSSNDTVWKKAMLKGSSASGYKLVSDNEMLREVGGLLKSGKSWTNLDAYCLQKWPYTIIKPETILTGVDWDNAPTSSNWLILERAAGKTPPVFALRTDKGASKIGIMETNVSLIYDEKKSPELLDVTVFSSPYVQLSKNGEYKGEKDNAILREIDGLLKTKNWKTFATYKSGISIPGLSISSGNITKYTGTATDVVIPYGVTGIGKTATTGSEGAFCGCSNLKTVTLPNSVTEIGKYAFYACYVLDCDITIPDSCTIGECAFLECKKLKSVTLPKTLTTIESSVFWNCVSLTNIIIPDNVTSIGAYAFAGTAITSINFPKGITTISMSLFYGCRSLNNVTIPSHVTSIENNVFDSCTNLTNITIEGPITALKEATFGGCTNLPSITIPASVTSIGKECFSGCTSLTSITIPASVTTIGARGFYQCENLANITFLSTSTLPTFEKSRDFSVFYGCPINTVTVTQALINNLQTKRNETETQVKTYIKSTLNTAGATAIETVNIISG